MKPEETIANVIQITPMTDRLILLSLAPHQYIPYEAGQYLQIEVEGSWLSYSIANAPLGAHHYELHIRHDSQNANNVQLFANIKQQGQVHIQLPYGDCHIGKLDKNLPILFIAGGTGFAPIHAMIEALLAEGLQQEMTLYWLSKESNDLYFDSKLKEWQSHVNHFHYVPLLSDMAHIDVLKKKVADTYGADVDSVQVVIAGPFDMVYAVRDVLLALGFLRKRLHADAFSFEERSE